MAKPKHDPALVDAIKKTLTGAETGVITSEGDAFNSNLPEGITPEVVDGVSNYVTTFVAAGMEAVGDVALAAMKKDKKLETCTAELPMGGFGQAGYQVHRSKTVNVPPTEKGGEMTTKEQFGATKVDVTFVAGKNSGLLGKARDAIKTAAAEQFGKK